ncbi:transcription elongation factor GreA [Patescibacteria group bacterium]|nr:transcription elongation factor GreA [Patescibacteria group bacterium]MBU1868637.1 transcription elongation factor GreA [Patescibacteria group bacterium]
MTKDEVKNLVTPQGLAKLKEEYERLTKAERPKLLKEVSELRSMGDLKENAAFHYARKQQAILDGRILDLELIIRTAVVKEKTDSTIVHLGSHVTVEFEDEQQGYIIVGESEANFLEGKISASSPLGKMLFGKVIGDEVIVEAPAGEMKYKVVKIE